MRNLLLVTLAAWLLATPVQALFSSIGPAGDEQPAAAVHGGISFRLGADPDFRDIRTVRATARRVAERHGLRFVRINRLGVIDAHGDPSRLGDLARRLALDVEVDWAEAVPPGEWIINDVHDPWPNDPRFDDAWHLENTGQSGGLPGADVKARAAWGIETGARETVVAILDSGTELEHEDLYGAAWRNSDETMNGLDDDNNGFVDDLWGWDFANGNNDPRPTNSAHGTEVAGLIAARTHNGVGVAGIAGGWGGRGGVALMTIQIGESSPLGEVLDDGILYAVDNGADIISLSLSVSPSRAIDAAVEEARRAGVLVVVAAGNSGGGVRYPAVLDDAVAIGATTRADTLWRSSARGPEIILTAPGKDIITTNLMNRYVVASGTSFAAPLVAGIAGLVASASPEEPNRDDLLLALTRSAEDLGEPGRDDLYGWGRVDAHQAIVVRNEELGHVGGTVFLPQPTESLAGNARVRIPGLLLDVLVDKEDQSYLLPLPEGVPWALVATAWGLAPDTVWAEVNAGGMTWVDLAPGALPTGGIEGLTQTESGSATPARVRVLPAVAHPEIISPGAFRLRALAADSVLAVEARGVLRSAIPETTTVVAGENQPITLALRPTQDFDANKGGMRSDGGLWEHGAGVSAHTEPAVWAIGLHGHYAPDADASLYAPPLRVGAAAASLAFFQEVGTEDGFDGGNLKARLGSDTTWTVLQPTPPYPLSSFPSGNLALRGEPGWSGRQDWSRIVVPLDAFAGQVLWLRWHFGSDDSIGSEGWWIDDLMLLGDVLPAVDISLKPAAAVRMSPGDSVDLDVAVTNRWDRNVSLRLRWLLDGVKVAALPFGQLAEGQSRSIGFTRRVPAIAPGVHSVVVEVLVEGRAFDAAGLLLEIQP